MIRAVKTIRAWWNDFQLVGGKTSKDMRRETAFKLDIEGISRQAKIGLNKQRWNIKDHQGRLLKCMHNTLELASDLALKCLMF